MSEKQQNEQVRQLFIKALSGEILSDAERDVFDDWKFNHSSDDIINLLEEIGAEKSNDRV